MDIIRHEIRNLLGHREARQTQELLRVNYQNLGDFSGTIPVQDSWILEVSGPTYEYRDTLKQLGLKWSPKRQMWTLDAVLYKYPNRATSAAWTRNRALMKAALPVLEQLAKAHNDKALQENKALRPMTTKDHIERVRRFERMRPQLEAAGLVLKWVHPNHLENKDSKLFVSGNTYPFRALMQKYGFTWDGSKKAWWIDSIEYGIVGDKWMGEIVRLLPRAAPPPAGKAVFQGMSDAALTKFLLPVVEADFELNEGYDGEMSYDQVMARYKLNVRRMSPVEQEKFHEAVTHGRMKDAIRVYWGVLK